MENGWTKVYMTSKVYRSTLEKARLEIKNTRAVHIGQESTPCQSIGKHSNLFANQGKAKAVKIVKRLLH